MLRASRSVFSSSALRGRLRIRAARADREQLVLGLDHVAGAGDQQRLRRVGDDQQRLEPAQHAVRAPILRELDRSAREIAVLLELALEVLEQRERVGGAACKAGEHLAVMQPPHLAGVALHDLGAERDLPVAAERDAAARRTQTIVVPWKELLCRSMGLGARERAARSVPALARARVRLVVDLREMLEVEVRVDLRRRQARMAEHLLHRAQVPARLEQVGGERVPQHVRMHALRPRLAASPNG